MTDEIVTIVDKRNRMIGTASRSAMRKGMLLHRASFVILFNSLEQIFVQRRTPIKDVYPGNYEPAAGGVVLAGESYESCARRELWEELGVSGVRLSSHGDFYFEDVFCRVWGRVFSCIHDGPFVLQQEEVESGRFMGLEMIWAESRIKSFTPDSLQALQLLFRHDNQLN